MNLRYLLVLAVLIVCGSWAQAEQVTVGQYQVLFEVPENAEAVSQSEGGIVGFWVVPSENTAILIGVSELDDGIQITESGIKEGIQETVGATVDTFSDFGTGKLTFRESYSDLPGKGRKFYSAHWWKPGLFVKVQGVYEGDHPESGLEVLRQVVRSVQVVSPQPIASSPSASFPVTPKRDMHWWSKTLGGYGTVALLVLIAIVAIRKRQQKNS